MSDVLSQYRPQIEAFLKQHNITTPIEKFAVNAQRTDLREEGGFKGFYYLRLSKFGVELYVKSWSEAEGHKLVISSPVPIDPIEKAKWEEEHKKLVEESKALNQEIANRVAKEAREALTEFSREGTSPYLTKKGIKGTGVYFRFPSRVDDKQSDLIIPIRDIDANIINYQVIYPSGDKDFLPGGKVSEGFFQFGTDPVTSMFVAEGYATAASIFEATHRTTVCAFSAGNIQNVVRLFRQKYPHIKITVCADNDRVGIQVANEAKKNFGACVVIPPTPDTDFNDYHLTDGVEKLKRAIFSHENVDFSEFNLKLLSELEQEPIDPPEYLVHDLLPKHGSSMVGGPPKSGKTSAVRDLIKRVCDGGVWLGRVVKQGVALYVGLEDQEAYIKIIFIDKLQVRNKQNLMITLTAPHPIVDKLKRLILVYKPDLVVVDTLGKGLKIKDVNNYGEVLDQLSALAQLGKSCKTHVMMIHHTAKKAESMLGSQIFEGEVDTLIYLTPKEGGKDVEIHSKNRWGTPLERTTLTYDPNTQTVGLGEKKATKASRLDSDKERLYKLHHEFKQPVSTMISHTAFKGRSDRHLALLEELASEGRLLKSKGRQDGTWQWGINPNYSGQIEPSEEY